MSKVITKIGPDTPHVAQEDIVSVSFGESPKTTIKYAKNHSVVFLDRNPYYVTITEPSEARNICQFLDEYESTNDERFLVMAYNNIQSTFSAYVSRELFNDFSESLVNALKNSKNIGRRQQSQQRTV